MNNRTLRRPMFRMGGSTGEGITSGLQAPRQKYMDAGDVQKIQEKKSLIDTLAPRPERQDNSFNNFLITAGLDLLQRPKSGNILSQIGASTGPAFKEFQQAKQIEQAYKDKEGSEDRALITEFVKNLSDEEMSNLRQEATEGFEAGLFSSVDEGVRQLLNKKIYGVQDMAGEKEGERIRQLELMLVRDQGLPTGIVNAVATHIYKIETNGYDESIMADLNRTKTFIKPSHIVGRMANPEGGAPTSIILDAKYVNSYVKDQIYFEPGSGKLYKNVSKEGEAPKFVLVE